jgi:RNA-directed DNA polymerase
MNDITFEEVVTSYYDCRRSKRNTQQQLEFEFNLEKNLWKLYEELKEEAFTPDKHNFFIITHPKPREVWCSNFRDRIVHHLIYNRTNYIESDYIDNTYACLKGKGTLRCAQNVQKTMRNLWKEKDDYKFLHVDIANFFVSIDREIIKKQLYPKIQNETTIKLIDIFLNQSPTENYYYTGDPKLKELIPDRKSLFGKSTGLTIGNLTSQIFANHYLNEFDWYCKENISQYYFRYMDDLLFFIHKDQKIYQIIDDINDYLRTLNMSLNSSKTKHNKLKHGVNFVGYFIRPFCKYIRNSTKQRAKLATEPQSINSYYGLMRQANCYNLRKKIAIQNNLNMINYEKMNKLP